jgi:peptide subunit release factor 1 (eRF1)
MIDEKLLSKLVSYDKNNYPVTSTYLSTSEDLGDRRKHLVKLKELIQYKKDTTYFKELSEEEKASVLEDFDKIYNWFSESFDSRHYRSGIVYSSSKNDLWETINLKIPVKNEFAIQHKPYIRPLASMLSDYNKYAVVLIDKAKSRVFENRFGEYIEHFHDKRDDLEEVKVGGFYGREERKYERHQHEAIVKHFKNVADKVFNLDQKFNFHWIILGGRKEATSEFKEHLHNYLKDKVIGSIKIDPMADLNDVLKKAKDMESKARQKFEKKLLEEFDFKREKGLGIEGFDEVFDAILKGQIDTLMIPEDLERKGVFCRHDNYLNTEVEEECPLCGSNLERTRDVVEHLIEKAINQSSKVQLMEEEPDAVDNIAATLRYPKEEQ